MKTRPIDANQLYRIEKLLDTDIVKKDKVASELLEQVLYDIQHMPTLTPPVIGYCKDCNNWNEDCNNWNEQFSAGRKSLNNYVRYCGEWSDPENGYKRYTLLSDYCSYFVPKEDMEDGKNDWQKRTHNLNGLA